MTAAAQIVVDQRSNVLRVPDQALQFTPSVAKAQAAPDASTSAESSPPKASPSKGQVWVVRGNAPVAVTVVTGLDDGSFTEIADGDLHPGDQIIVGENRPQNSSQQGAP